MGMPTAQAAQPISQQQPTQGKGGSVSSAPEQVTIANPAQMAPSAIEQHGKGQSAPQPQTNNQPQFQGKGGTTNTATSGQPQIGRPNNYSNTIQPWDNANIQPRTQSGKGKGY